MPVRIINPSADPRWDAFVAANDIGCVYHHSAWKDVLERTYNHMKPLYFVLENTNNEIESGIGTFHVKSFLTGNRLVSLPFSSFGDPLAKNQNEARKIMNAVILKGQDLKVDYIEFRLLRSHNFVHDVECELSNQFLTHILSLNRPKEELFRSFHVTSVRQRIKRAEKNSLKLIVGKNDRDIEQFFGLHMLTRKKHGLPCQPKEFFKNMWEMLHPKEMIMVLLVEFLGNIVAGTILLKHKKTVYSEYSASDDRFLRVNPNHWLLWKAIEMAKYEGYEFFDFGRSSRRNKGLIDFKKRWGGKEYPLHYFYYPKQTGWTSAAVGEIKYMVLTRLIKHLPPKITEWSGRILYKHLGG